MITEKECTNLYNLLLGNRPEILAAALLGIIIVLYKDDPPETRNALAQLGLISPNDLHLRLLS